jgi:hypothetical protein
MIVVTAREIDLEGASRDVLHVVVRPRSTAGRDLDVHVASRPSPGVPGYEVDLRVLGYGAALGVAPLIATVLGLVDPIPLDHEPVVHMKARLELRDEVEFERRARERAGR